MTDLRTRHPHPIQPLDDDGKGVLRFKGNAIVRHLLDKGGIDLNKLACLEFSDEDRQQFAQLIGYSLSGYGELSYVDDPAYHAAATSAGKKDRDPTRAKLKHALTRLKQVKAAFRKGVAILYEKHPDDLA